MSPAEAQGPMAWKVDAFRSGPCDVGNPSQLPAGESAAAIAQACSSFNDIQERYSGNCFLASDCKVTEAAKTEIAQTMNNVWDAFSDAGFVLPYSNDEQQVFP